VVKELSAGIGDDRITRPVEADGIWCPMAHADRSVTSCQGGEPLTRVESVERVGLGVAPAAAGHHLGAFTGSAYSVCAYASPFGPALVAFDHDTGEVRWTSPPGDLWASPRRAVSALLLARVATSGGRTDRRVFAGNPFEFLAYDQNGMRQWGTRTADWSPGFSGVPVSVNYTDDGELVTGTDEGWFAKLQPTSGTVSAAWCVPAVLGRGRRAVTGRIVSPKSIATQGNTVYFAGVFQPSRPWMLTPERCPTYLVRMSIPRGSEPTWTPLVLSDRSGRERRLVEQPRVSALLIGRHRVGGSPSTFVAADGTRLVLANGEVYRGGRPLPVVVAIEDVDGLRARWWCVLSDAGGARIHAAPAVHGRSQTLVVSTSKELRVFRGIGSLEGRVVPPDPVAVELRAQHRRTAHMGVGSPQAVVEDPRSGRLIVYTNLRERAFGTGGERSSLIALAVSPGPEGERAEILWKVPFAGPNGRAEPGPGTFGQAALFKQSDGRRGLIVNTVAQGTFVLS
jgi:hypothetical protein